jgi:hypothetical protein
MNRYWASERSSIYDLSFIKRFFNTYDMENKTECLSVATVFKIVGPRKAFLAESPLQANSEIKAYLHVQFQSVILQ